MFRSIAMQTRDGMANQPLNISPGCSPRGRWPQLPHQVKEAYPSSR